MTAGRPAKFSSPQELQAKIDEYFARKRPAGDCPSISELSLELGFCDRHSFYDMEKTKKFSHTVKCARSKLTAFFEHNPNPIGHIFMMKNLGYSDKHEIDTTVHVPDTITVEVVSKRQ
jgi:hypothetical protein